MRFVILILLTILLILAAYFFTLNQGIYVERVFVGFDDFGDVPLFLVVFWSVAVGIVWALLVFLLQEIRLRLRLFHFRGENKKLRKELDMLRLQPLKDIDTGLLDKEHK